MLFRCDRISVRFPLAPLLPAVPFSSAGSLSEAAKPKRAKPCRVLVNSDTRLYPLEARVEDLDGFCSSFLLALEQHI